MPRRGLEEVGLPGYAWEARASRYTDKKTGRFVAKQDVQNLLRDVTQGAEDRMGTYGELYARNDITSRQFYELMQREIRLTTNASTALARGGIHNVSQADWGRNGARCRREYNYLREFIVQAENGELSEGQISARARLYANEAYGRYWEIETQMQREAGAQWERLVTVGDDRVCEECVGIERQGWLVIGAIELPIHPGCRCDKEFKNNVSENSN